MKYLHSPRALYTFVRYSRIIEVEAFQKIVSCLIDRTQLLVVVVAGRRERKKYVSLKNVADSNRHYMCVSGSFVSLPHVDINNNVCRTQNKYCCTYLKTEN